MNIKVIIPWRPEPTREPGFHWVCEHYRQLLGDDSLHIELDSSTGPFNRSKLINRGVARFPTSTVVVSDADCLVSDAALRRAIDEVGDFMILPHNRRLYTTQEEAARILSTDPAAEVTESLVDRERGMPAMGISVIKAELFLDDPMDERFVGWGHEDAEFLRRVPYTRYGGTIFHLWHERPDTSSEEKNRILSKQILRERDGRRLA